MGAHQHGDGSTVYPETELCQAYNITASIFPRQQKQWGCYANFPYMAHVWSAAHPAAVLPPPPISLSPLHPNQEHFLLSVQSFMAASGGANGTLKQELRREVKLLFAEELQNVVKLDYLCVSKIWYHPDVLLLLLHSPEGLFLSQTHAAVLRKC